MDASWEDLLDDPGCGKEERFQRVAWSVAVSMMRRGPETLQIAEVARRAGVSRAWIYKYVAPDKDALIAYAVGVFGGAFGAPSVETPAVRSEDWAVGVTEGTQAGLHAVTVAPWCLLLLVRYRHARGPLGDQLRGLEAEHLAAFVARMPEVLRRNGPRARRFAATFYAARLGLMHQWMDRAWRAEWSEADAAASLAPLVDAFVATVR